ncbi:MAG: permease-like cell division protein FtsX [Archangium sp.]|nr:permease-like cell division protein FtsX [Archangium sp.]MDP3154043.1 permease-like cell division protein FtsX [Archangium sp.]MDP3570054.1 permease-like cell division protein FtsX [Archangium sp.]
MSTSARVAYFVRTAIGSMVRSPFVHVIAVAALGLSLVGFGMARIASSQLDALLASLGGEVEFTVYLATDAPPAQVDELERALTNRTGGTLARISPATALGRLAAQLGEQGKALTELGDNPLPWSLELKLPPNSREPAALKQLAEKTRALPFVSGVDYGEEALERLGVISRAMRLAGLVAFVLVFLTTVIVVSATLQLAIFARREEIEIQKLVGGTDRFVRMPFLIEGALQGIFAGLFALAAVFALVRWVEREGGDLVGFLMLDGRFVVAWGRLALEQLGLGIALGLSGSFIAVRRFLRV